MGCTGRAYADLSADADPNTGLEVVEDGNWGVVGGTSLATPLIAAYYAITGIDDTTNNTSAKWAYATRQRAAQRHHLRLQRHLQRQHQLHLHGRHRLRRANRHGLDFR